VPWSVLKPTTSVSPGQRSRAKLAEVELAAAGEVGGACVAEVRVVRPDDDPRRAAGAREVFGERVERLCHVLVAHVPARDVAADERAVVALRVADEPRALLGGEEAVLGDAAVARGQLGGTLAKLDQLRHDLVLARLVREGVCLRIRSPPTWSKQAYRARARAAASTRSR